MYIFICIYIYIYIFRNTNINIHTHCSVCTEMCMSFALCCSSQKMPTHVKLLATPWCLSKAYIGSLYIHGGMQFRGMD